MGKRDEVIADIESKGWKVLFSVPSLTQARDALDEIVHGDTVEIRQTDTYPEYVRDGELFTIVFRAPRTFYVVKKQVVRT